MLSKEKKREYQRVYMRKVRAGETTAKDNGQNHLIAKLTWIDISGYPGYMASDCGQILSKSRDMVRSNGRKHTVPAKVLKQNADSTGYMQVGLYVDKKRSNRQVHRLVHLAWIGDIPEGMVVDHIDANRKNNRAGNLQVLTPTENTLKGWEDAKKEAFNAGYAKCLKDIEALNHTPEVSKAISKSLNMFNDRCNDLLAEDWKPLEGWEDVYEVNSKGHTRAAPGRPKPLTPQGV